jgi:hypothetical protein
MANDWFCEIAGRELGPLSSHQLKTMAAKGQILPSDCVRQGAAGKWVPSGQVKGLFAPRQDAPQTTAGRQPAAATQPPHPSSPTAAHPSPPAVPRVARPIVLPKAEAAQQPPDAPPPVSTPGFPHVMGDLPFDFDSEPAGHSYAPPAYDGKSIAARAHAKRRQQQQQLLAGSLVLVVVGVAIAGIFLALGGPVNVGEVGGGGLTDLPKQLEKAAAAKSAGEKSDASDARKGGDRTASAKSKKPAKDDAAKSKKPATDDGGKVKPTDKPENAQPDEKNAKPPEKPADKADDAKWVDASMSPAVVSDIPVQVLSAAQKPGKAGAAGGDLLIVMLQVKNPSRLYTMEFAGWSREAAQKGVVMTDDQGKSYPAQSIDTTAFLVKPLPVTVKPYELAKDVLAFEAPGPKVKFLRLELSATAFGKIGTANLQIPVRMITGAAAAVESAPAKPPETAPPAAPPPKKERPAPRPGTPEADFGIDPDEVPKDGMN